jgi:hypothetical protein
MEFTPLASDFTGFALDLSPAEQSSLAEIRSFMEERVRPVIDEHWHRDAFPTHLIPGIAALGVVGPGWPETARFENSAVYRGWIALEMSRVDASVSTFVGVQNGLVAGSIGVAGSPAQRQEWLPRLADCSVVGAFGLTEPLSGSDAAQGLRTTATPEPVAGPAEPAVTGPVAEAVSEEVDAEVPVLIEASDVPAGEEAPAATGRRRVRRRSGATEAAAEEAAAPMGEAALAEAVIQAAEVADATVAEVPVAEEKPKRRRTTRKKAEPAAEEAPAPEAATEAAPAEEPVAEEKPKRKRAPRKKAEPAPEEAPAPEAAE